MQSPERRLARAFLLGCVCGSRSILGPALLVRKHPPTRRAAPPLLATLLPIFAAGEFIGDKLPFTPGRTNLGSVIFRTLSGASVGAALFATEQDAPAAGAIAGGLGALAATFGLYYLRRFVDKTTGIPDPIVGALEDAGAFALGTTVVGNAG